MGRVNTIAVVLFLGACEQPIGHPPIARIDLVPAAIPAFDNFQTVVELDGQASADPVDDPDDSAPLTYRWQILDSETRNFVYEGEMSLDAALDPELRSRMFPASRLEKAANILIFAYSDAANAARNILRMKAGGLEVGPILMGMGNKAHIVTPSITARGLLNVSAIAGTPVAHYG